jgi:hypothetical protein
MSAPINIKAAMSEINPPVISMDEFFAHSRVRRVVLGLSTKLYADLQRSEIDIAVPEILSRDVRSSL